MSTVIVGRGKLARDEQPEARSAALRGRGPSETLKQLSNEFIRTPGPSSLTHISTESPALSARTTISLRAKRPALESRFTSIWSR